MKTLLLTLILLTGIAAAESEYTKIVLPRELVATEPNITNAYIFVDSPAWITVVSENDQTEVIQSWEVLLNLSTLRLTDSYKKTLNWYEVDFSLPHGFNRLVENPIFGIDVFYMSLKPGRAFCIVVPGNDPGWIQFNIEYQTHTDILVWHENEWFKLARIEE